MLVVEAKGYSRYNLFAMHDLLGLTNWLSISLVTLSNHMRGLNVVALSFLSDLRNDDLNFAVRKPVFKVTKMIDSGTLRRACFCIWSIGLRVNVGQTCHRNILAASNKDHCAAPCLSIFASFSSLVSNPERRPNPLLVVIMIWRVLHTLFDQERSYRRPCISVLSVNLTVRI